MYVDFIMMINYTSNVSLLLGDIYTKNAEMSKRSNHVSHEEPSLANGNVLMRMELEYPYINTDSFCWLKTKI